MQLLHFLLWPSTRLRYHFEKSKDLGIILSVLTTRTHTGDIVSHGMP